MSLRTVSLSNLSGSIGTVLDTEFYSPAALLNIAATQPNGFVGVGVQVTSTTVGIGSTFDLGFGADTSLIAQPGWDDATGYGVPDGLAFIRAAAKAAR